jgi:DNA-binding NarL/FixJ family response regulator
LTCPARWLPRTPWSPASTPPRAASPLSPRESEVAGLVGLALSNRQIAERLVLSERTVETHVRSILAKLGYSTRTEVATWSLRNRSGGLEPRQDGTGSQRLVLGRAPCQS